MTLNTAKACDARHTFIFYMTVVLNTGASRVTHSELEWPIVIKNHQ